MDHTPSFPRRLALSLATLLLAGLALATPVRAQDCGHISLDSQAQVDAFACTSVTGDLAIQGPDITDLSGLSGVTSVGGHLIIHNNATLATLSGLSGVTSVGGGLSIQNNATLATLAGLSGVTSVAYLTIHNNAMLASLAGLENVTSLIGSLRIQDNATLASLSGLSGVTSVGGGPFGGGLVIQSNPMLASLSGLENVASVGAGGLIIHNNATLASLSGLSGVTSVGGGLTIQSNAALASLTGLENVASVGLHLSIENNATLVSLTGLSGVTSVAYLTIQNNAMLASLSGLESVTDVNDLTIENNAALASLDGLSGLTTVYGFLIIKNNAALATLTGLSGLESDVSVGIGGIIIENNATLASLDGLENVTYVFDLIIQNNATLRECSCGLAGVIYDYNYEAIFIQGNDPGGTCTSPEVVMATPCVTNQPPVIAGVTVPAEPVAVGVDAVVSASFTDLDAGDTPTCAVDFGDGTTAPGTVSGLTCTGTHAYSATGVYTVAVTVTDAAGESDTKAATDYVVVYDPSAGFVTGGGWIDSPEGAYVPVPTLTGRASFGFVAKYKKGRSTPDGNTQFQFNAAGFTFRSTAYAWLVIAGPYAKFKGIGTMDGAGDYGFMITATDGEPDRFRIKIWDADDVVVYDNQMGEGDDSNAGTDLGGGQVMIHRKGGSSAAGGTSVSRGGDDAAPVVFALSAAYPNPFAVSATVAFDVPETAVVRVVVYDVLGREVAVLADGAFEAARHQAILDGRGLPTGTYLVRMMADGGFAQTQRVTLMR